MTMQYEPGVLYEWKKDVMPEGLDADQGVVVLSDRSCYVSPGAMPHACYVSPAGMVNWPNVREFIVLKPRLVSWINVYDDGSMAAYQTEEAALALARTGCVRIAVRLVEEMKK